MTTNNDFRAHLLMYDVPTSARCVPSAIMWRFGARVNLSCWIVPDRNVPLLPIAEWKAKGARVELVRFDERDGATILRLAREALMGEIGRMRAALDESVDDVRAKLEGVASGDEKAMARASAYARSHVRKAKNLVVHARDCAMAFDILGDVQHLVNGLRDAARAKDALYYGWIKARQDNLPLPVEADAVAAVQSEIEPVPVAEPVAEPQTAEPVAAMAAIQTPAAKANAAVFGGSR